MSELDENQNNENSTYESTQSVNYNQYSRPNTSYSNPNNEFKVSKVKK